jgi:hypothetical protein
MKMLQMARGYASILKDKGKGFISPYNIVLFLQIALIEDWSF